MIITAGIYKGRKLYVPPENITRPTLSKTRMGVFNSLYSLLGDFKNKSFFDAFGGSGIMGLEALSRGYSDVTVCEINKQSAEIIKKNYSLLGLKPNLYVKDCRKVVKENKAVYDVVYIDPPYKSEFYDEIIQTIKAKVIVVEHDNTIDLSKYNMLKQKNYGGNNVTYIDGESLFR